MNRHMLVLVLLTFAGRLTRNDNDPLALAALARGSKGYSLTMDEIKALSMPLLAVPRCRQSRRRLAPEDRTRADCALLSGQRQRGRLPVRWLTIAHREEIS
jgi:hypothetical protein